METVDMKEFKIMPEKFLRYHASPVDVNFLINYEAGLPLAKLRSINVNGRTHHCKEGLGELAGSARGRDNTGEGSPAFRSTTPQPITENLVIPWLAAKDPETEFQTISTSLC